MCFSAQASFIGAGIIGTIGIASVVRAKKPLRLLAITPIFFAIQQAIEGINWITINLGDTSSLLHKTSIYSYLVFAFIVWPIWIPFVLYKIEKKKKRKTLLGVNIIIGCVLALICSFFIVFLGQKVEIKNHHIYYIFAVDPVIYFPKPLLLFAKSVIFYIYLLPTVGSFFISSLRLTWLLGIVFLMGWLISIMAYSMTFESVWCFFGAMGTILIYFIVKKA